MDAEKLQRQADDEDDDEVEEQTDNTPVKDNSTSALKSVKIVEDKDEAEKESLNSAKTVVIKSSNDQQPKTANKETDIQ